MLNAWPHQQTTSRTVSTGSWLLLATSLSLLLSACGFHLRGAVALPDELKSMRLSCPSIRERNFCQTLERQLAGNGISTNNENADYLLNISNIDTSRRTVSVNERSVASEIELKLNVEFSLSDKAGVSILPSSSVSSTQTYQYDQNQVLGKGREEQQIKRDLSQQLATQILARLATLTQARIDQLRGATDANTATPVSTAAPADTPAGTQP